MACMSYRNASVSNIFVHNHLQHELTSTFSPAKKEAKRLEKEAKLAAKAAKLNATAVVSEKKQKEKKEKKEEEAPFINTTPKGHKKGEQ